MPLLQSVFLSPETHHAHGKIVAFTAADDAHGGVKSVVQALAIQIAAITGRRVLIAEATSLQGMQKQDALATLESCTPTDNPNVWVLTDAFEIAEKIDDRHGKPDKVDVLLSRAWKHNPDFGRETLREVQKDFDFVLIECEQTQEAAILGPIVDGVIIIASAGRTKRAEIKRTQQTIEATGGKIAGFVLNRYRRPLPGWLNNRL